MVGTRIEWAVPASCLAGGDPGFECVTLVGGGVGLQGGGLCLGSAQDLTVN